MHFDFNYCYFRTVCEGASFMVHISLAVGHMSTNKTTVPQATTIVQMRATVQCVARQQDSKYGFNFQVHTTHNTHTHTRDMPPPDQLRLVPLCATSGNTGPSARQTPGAGPSIRRSTDYVPPLWCGHPKSHLYLRGIRHSQWSCPSPA